MWFEALPSLRINLGKSTIQPVGRVKDPGILAMELGCEVDSLPSSYLGFPLGEEHNSTQI